MFNKTIVEHVNEKRKSQGAKKLAAVKKAEVTHFLCRDENSRLLPKKKKKRDSSKKSPTKTNERVTFTIQQRNTKGTHTCHTDSLCACAPST